MDILLVCTGNTCRSSMAEGIFKQILKDNDDDDVHVTSAGISVYVSTEASEYAVEVMEDMEIDISDHMSSQITKEDVINSDLVLVMTPSHKNTLIDLYPEYMDKIYTLMEYAYDSDEAVADPFGLDKDAYYECALQIKDALQRVYSKIKQYE